MTITVKDLPVDIHAALKEAAKARGKSLNSYVISILAESVEEDARRRVMRERWAEYQKFLATLPPLSDSTSLIREDRDQDHR
jgi:uncharacterized protein (DUF1778 family)